MSRNRCICSRIGNSITTNKRWNELLVRCRTRKYHPGASHICKQESIKHREKVQQYREALGILHGLQKFYHYCFTREVSVIIDPLLTIFKKDVALLLLHRLQCTLLRNHHYRIWMLYKHGKDLLIADWLPEHNHKEDKDEEISGMRLNIDAAYTSRYTQACVHMRNPRDNAERYALTALKQYIISGWPTSRHEIPPEVLPYWIFIYDLGVTDKSTDEWQKNHYTRGFRTVGTKTITQQPYCHQEGKATNACTNLLG